MMRHKMFRRFLMGLSFLSLGVAFTGCSSSDDDEQLTPEEKGIEQGSDQRPDWQVPNFDAYEMTMSVEVLLQSKLQPYASSQDLLCATINGEVRGVAFPHQVENTWVFPLTIGSNDGSANMLLSYYCDRLHRIFTTTWTNFDATTMPMGSGGIYQPTFVE